MIYALYTRSIGLGAISVKMVLALSAITIAAGLVWGIAGVLHSFFRELNKQE
jgi:pilus assembly protein TadC